MKFLIAAFLVISGNAFAYTSSPVGNKPVRDPAWNPEQREPASVPTKVKEASSGKKEMSKEQHHKK